ncbi:hypothetical protein PPERSA_11935 [Pseudocohnilembus persalinus]|uniref:Uncharacterized protein n=1 Tax=Pseudocohnilembus persalinus TaxID=266149 RepID=A0A0V0QJV9_PSEPJ|nr:hypothetical protein PPERSA_11935 [Pseudocohnilembus persalinus]|eukprot:KRX02595.1 hypothetical protein PPERSA_11935 [Pseudocohnilembus persalinus]
MENQQQDNQQLNLKKEQQYGNININKELFSFKKQTNRKVLDENKFILNSSKKKNLKDIDKSLLEDNFKNSHNKNQLQTNDSKSNNLISKILLNEFIDQSGNIHDKIINQRPLSVKNVKKQFNIQNKSDLGLKIENKEIRNVENLYKPNNKHKEDSSTIDLQKQKILESNQYWSNNNSRITDTINNIFQNKNFNNQSQGNYGKIQSAKRIFSGNINQVQNRNKNKNFSHYLSNIPQNQSQFKDEQFNDIQFQQMPIQNKENQIKNIINVNRKSHIRQRSACEYSRQSAKNKNNYKKVLQVNNLPPVFKNDQQQSLQQSISQSQFG